MKNPIKRIATLALSALAFGTLSAESLRTVSSVEGGYYTLTETKTFKNVSIPYVKTASVTMMSSYGTYNTYTKVLSDKQPVGSTADGLHYWEQSSSEITCQAQWRNSYPFGFQLKFQQSGADVIATLVNHHYYFSNTIGKDLRNEPRGGTLWREEIPNSDTSTSPLALVNIELVVSDEAQIEMDAQWDGAGSGVKAGDTLVWNGGAEGTWDGTTENWLKMDGTAIRWVKGCTPKFTAPAVVTLDGYKNVAGLVSASGTVVLRGDELRFADAAQVVYTGDTTVRFENDVKGENGLTTQLQLGDQEYTLAGNLTTEPQKVASGVSIDTVSALKMTIYNRFGAYAANLRTISNVIEEGGSGDGIYHWNLDEEKKVLTAQFWWNNSHKMAALLEITEVDGDLYARIVKSYYLFNGKWGDDCTTSQDFGNVFRVTDAEVDAEKTTSSSCKGLVITAGAIPTTYGLQIAGDYSVKGVTKVENGFFDVVDEGTMGSGLFSGELQVADRFRVSSTAENNFGGKITTLGIGLVETLPGSVVTFSSNIGSDWRLFVSGDTYATGYSTLPTNSGAIEVLEGGCLRIGEMNGEWGPNGGGTPIVVSSGAVLSCEKNNSIGVWKHIHVNGGELQAKKGTSQQIYQFHLSDGGRFTGGTAVAGYNTNYGRWSFIEVSETKASTFAAENLVIDCKNNKDATVADPSGLKLIVEDVTDDAASDLIVTSTITERDAESVKEREGTGLWKQGAGTVEFTSGALACPSGVFRLEEGKVRFAATAGGTLGALVLAGDATIDVVSGAQVSFDDASELAWTPEKKLTITGALGKRSIRVGTSAEALTSAQLAQIVYRTAAGKECPVSIDANGYLSGPKLGFTLLVR